MISTHKMKYRKAIAQLTGVCLLTIFSIPLTAQQSKVDSIIHLLNKSMTNNILDSAAFVSVLDLISTASLTMSQINQIETAVAAYNDREKEILKFGVFNNLLQNTN
jgi:hypothetical protein